MRSMKPQRYRGVRVHGVVKKRFCHMARYQYGISTSRVEYTLRPADAQVRKTKAREAMRVPPNTPGRYYIAANPARRCLYQPAAAKRAENSCRYIQRSQGLLPKTLMTSRLSCCCLTMDLQPACTGACTTDFRKTLTYHNLMKADLRISVKDYRPGKNLKNELAQP